MDIIKFKNELLKCIEEGLLKYEELNDTEKKLLNEQKIAEEITKKIKKRYSQS